MLTQDKLKSLLKYDQHTGNFCWLVSRGKAKKRQPAGWISKRDSGINYLKITISGKNYFAHRLAWFYTYGCWPVHHIDHIDHNPLNNAILNLRDVPASHNLKNKKLHKHNKVGVSGVNWHMPLNKWRARIRSDGKEYHIGYFDSLLDAVAARKGSEREHGFHKNHGAKN